MFQKLTIRKLSLFIAAIMLLMNFAIVYFLFNEHIDYKNFPNLFIVLLLGFLGTFFVIRYLLSVYVFRQIKVIHQIIHDSKVKTPTNAMSMSTTNLEAVNNEVVAWAERTEKEIQTLKTLEQYRKDFVGNISHELKTPIFSIQGYLHTLLDGGLHDENINIKYLERATKNAERLQSIVEDLEEISKLESGKLVLDIRKFDIRELVREVFQDVNVIAEERGIELLMDDNQSPLYVMADSSTIRQVLTNLIINSLKYGDKGGKTRIDFFDIDKNILIEISDNGIGISEEHLKHLFDRFYRVDTSRSRTQGGSGLGLSIVKHIIEAHNQTINVRSTEGEGSTFGFTLKKA